MKTVNTASFIKSAAYIKDAPKTELPEYAFIGRSNVGKSSLINYLTGVKNLAKTSGTPGKTQLINFFLINDAWILTDLPGIGYAKVSKFKRSKWSESSDAYLQKRLNLLCIFYLIDVRHKPLVTDTEFMEWLAEKGLPFVIVFTKADKINNQELNANVTFYKNHMLKTWEELPPIFITSAEKKFGKDEIISFITETNSLVLKK